MEKVFVKSGIVQGDLSFKIHEIYDFPEDVLELGLDK